MDAIRRDVVIVGAGVTGLVAATALRKQGLSVTVLEARERVGGRLAHSGEGDQFFELGGQWFSPDQSALLETLESLGLSSYPRYRDGSNVYVGPDGEANRYIGDIFPTSPETTANIDELVDRVERLAGEIDPAAPWDHPDASVLDNMSFESWLRAQCTDEEAIRNVTLFIASAMLTKPGHTFSVLQALQMAASAGSFAHLIDPDFVLDRRVVGGLHKVADGLAARLPAEDLHLSRPVDRLEWAEGSVVASAADLTVAARWAIVAVPPHLRNRISYLPALPAAHAQAPQHQSMGHVIKIQARYPRPFWREAGLSGTAFSPYQLVHEVYDNTYDGEEAGTLVGFVSDINADHAMNQPPSERRRLVLQSLETYFGDRALTPSDYNESDWVGEEWTQGAYGTSFDIGGLTRYGHDQLQPVGPLRFGSSDVAAEGYMHVDGAIRVGRRLAAEILEEAAPLTLGR